MRRSAATIALVLIAGAILNVAVAVALARLHFEANILVSPTWEPADHHDRLWWELHTGSSLEPLQTLNVEVTARNGYDFRMLVTKDGNHAMRTAAGWPMLSMEGSLLRRPVNTGVAGRRRYVQQSFSIYVPSGAEYTIPLRPRLRGFVFNTLFYALMLWLTVLSFRDLRTRARRRRGRCLRCAYDLRGGPHERCPECGVLVPLERSGGSSADPA